MTTFHQASLPRGWAIAGEATLPNGSSIAGTAARVFNLLAETARRQHRWQVGRHLAPAGWVPTWVLREPWAGGAAGDRRLRNLREAGIAIEGQNFSPGADEPGSSSWVWRLASGTTQASQSSARAAQSGGPLTGISIRLVADPTPPAGSIDISPGATSPLAPTFVACEDEAYRIELLSSFRSGRLVECLGGRTAVCLWTDPAARFDPRPVLQLALVKLGATLVGETPLGA